ncbi:hypothetical protein Tco_0552173 [Tanacetum coccineum]
MSSATSVVTYTSVYTDFEPGRAFWGADDEEISEGGIPRVIVLGYDGLPIQPVAPPSPRSKSSKPVPLSEGHYRSYYPKRYWELLPKEILGAITQRDTGSYYQKRDCDVLWENGGNLIDAKVILGE